MKNKYSEYGERGRQQGFQEPYDEVMQRNRDEDNWQEDNRGRNDFSTGRHGFQGETRQARIGHRMSGNFERNPSLSSSPEFPHYGRQQHVFGQETGFEQSGKFEGYGSREMEDRNISRSSGRLRQSSGCFTGRGPKGYRKSDDRIKEEICDLLTSNGELDASDIEVTVNEGVVTLSGIVENREMKRLAEDLIDDVGGVQDITNQIRTKSQRSGDQTRTEKTKSDNRMSEGQRNKAA